MTTQIRIREGRIIATVDGEEVGPVTGLRSALKDLGWTQADLARKSGYRPNTVNIITIGRREVPLKIWLVLMEALEDKTAKAKEE